MSFAFCARSAEYLRLTAVDIVSYTFKSLAFGISPY
nr:MAG TPA: hypothetical protein [Caudoviricetes sp.]